MDNYNIDPVSENYQQKSKRQQNLQYNSKNVSISLFYPKIDMKNQNPEP